MCKIFPTTFKKSIQVWYNNLGMGSIMGFNDLCAKFMPWFSTSIPVMRSFKELFGITQSGGKSTKVYLKRFNEEMLKVKELIELVALKALISGVRECSQWKDLYALSERSFFKVKKVMKNHIQVKKANMLRHRPPCFYQEVEDEKPFKQNRYSCRDNNSKKGQKMPVKDHIQYPDRRHMTPINANLMKYLQPLREKTLFSIHPSYGVTFTNTHLQKVLLVPQE